MFVFFFFNDTATTEIYTLSLHDALPISLGVVHPDLCPREDFEPYFEHLSQLDLRGYFALARDLLTHDASDLLDQIHLPVLVVAGERDLFTPLARSREMAARIPGAQLLVLREGGPAAMVEQPKLRL